MAKKDIYKELGFTPDQKKVVYPYLGNNEKLIRRFISLIQVPRYKPVADAMHKNDKEKFDKLFRVLELKKFLPIKKTKKKTKKPKK